MHARTDGTGARESDHGLHARPLAQDLLGFIGLDSTTARAWNRARWPGVLAAAMLVFAFAYYVTPDVQQRFGATACSGPTATA
jgi:uncharacterized BrkB/YihY/UPF0761 family membrane protein